MNARRVRRRPDVLPLNFRYPFSASAIVERAAICDQGARAERDTISDAHSMKTAHQTVTDPLSFEAEAPRHLASWYAPGWSDRIGDRLLMFDNTSAPSLELLRFKALLAAAPGFERALRERVEMLRGLRHPSFSEIRAVESLDGGDGLALVSNHVAGKRLAEILREAKGPSFALALIRQLTPALVLLQQQGDGVAHGAIAADRIVVTPEGRLVIVEHVLGRALERLNFTAERLWADLRIAVAPTANLLNPRLDGRTDVVQLAVTALTLLLGRPLRPDETPDRFPVMLDHIAKTTAPGSPSFPFLRNWLGRALQIDGQLFGSALDAQDALDDLPSDRGQQWRDFSRLLTAPSGSVDEDVETVPDHRPARPEPVVVRHQFVEEPAAAAVEVAAPPEPPAQFRVEEPAPISVGHEDGALLTAPRNSPPRESPLFSDERDLPRPPASSRASIRPEHVLRPPSLGLEYRSSRAAAPAHVNAASRPLGTATPPGAAAVDRPPARKGTPAWVTATLGVLAVCEALIIGGLAYVKGPFRSAAITIESGQPGSDVIVDGRSIGVTPLTLTVDSATKSVRVAPPAVGALAARGRSGERIRESSPVVGPPAPAAVHTATVPSVRSGGLRLSAPIDLEILENGRRLGSNAGPIVMTPGSHQLELVNAALGYRTRETVVVKNGQTTALMVSLPNGRLSVNALPWAEVWIDDKPVGETPLGNLSIPIGEHQVVFRHPQLGERRQLAVVRADGVSRVSVNLQQ